MDARTQTSSREESRDFEEGWSHSSSRLNGTLREEGRRQEACRYVMHTPLQQALRS